jgi:feruloyl-CoA synthase
MASSWTPSPFACDVDRRDDGSILLRPTASIEPYLERVTDALKHWAFATPDATFVARRRAGGDWTRVTYAQALERVQRIAGGLAAMDLSADRPLLILSGNSIEHLLLALAALHAGVPYCPVSPAYSQPSSDLATLRYVMELLTPGLVAAFEGHRFERAIAATVPESTPLVSDVKQLAGRECLHLDRLHGDTALADARNAAVNGDTIAKFMLTSGSTGHPKAVITTHRMLCSCQSMLHEALPFLANDPPVLVDWLPWNHTFGGSHNVGLVLFNGGTLYIDDGKPLPGAINETVRNLREISPTVYFNVPKGFELLAQSMQQDATLRANFYRRLQACFFGGAALSQHTWDLLDAQSNAELGRRMPVLSGLGATETSPCVTFTTPGNDRAGVIGLPAAGQVVKLAPVGDKVELRVKGPNVTPGYWRQPELTAAAFDEEGLYRLGDAVRCIDDSDPRKGLMFDGRIAEDFKLASGTWVSVGPLRARLLQALGSLALDVVIAGLNRDYLGLLIVPNWTVCAEMAGVARSAMPAEIARHEAVRAHVRQALASHAQQFPGNSTRIGRAILLNEPPSLDHGEITDKGSINQRAVLEHRGGDVDLLYATTQDPRVIVVDADERKDARAS